MTPGNTQIPLPPGEWVLLASDLSLAGTNTGGGVSNQHSAQVYYARLESGRIAQVIYANTSEGAPSAIGYVTGARCLATTPNNYLYYSDRQSGTFNAIDCTAVLGNQLFNPPGQTSSAIYRAAYQKAKEFGGLPRFSVRVEIAQAHSLRYTDYYSFFFPNQARAATRAADWQVDNLGPENKAFVDGVVQWSKTFREAVRLGTQYRL